MRGPSERRDDHDGRVQHQQPPATATGPHVQMVRVMVATVPLCAVVPMRQWSRVFGQGERRPEPATAIPKPPLDRFVGRVRVAVSSRVNSPPGRMMVVDRNVGRLVTAAGPSIVFRVAATSVRPGRHARRRSRRISARRIRRPTNEKVAERHDGPSPPRVVAERLVPYHRPGSADRKPWTRDGQQHLTAVAAYGGPPRFPGYYYRLTTTRYLRGKQKQKPI